MNNKNLTLLADWLIKNHSYLVEKNLFEMGNFRSEKDSSGNTGEFTEDLREASTPTCGTAGCAVGWGPFSQIPELAFDLGSAMNSEFAEEVIRNQVHELNTDTLWILYSKDKFGMDSRKFLGGWDWCFGAEWEDTDNTPIGAAIRIKFLIEHGVEKVKKILQIDYGYEDAPGLYREWATEQGIDLQGSLDA